MRGCRTTLFRTWRWMGAGRCTWGGRTGAGSRSGRRRSTPSAATRATAGHPSCRGGGRTSHRARPVAGDAYRYRLEVLLAGGGSRSEETGPLETGAKVSRLTWAALAPNPSQQALRGELLIPRAGRLEVRVYDVAGHVVGIAFRGAVS